MDIVSHTLTLEMFGQASIIVAASSMLSALIRSSLYLLLCREAIPSCLSVISPDRFPLGCRYR